MLLQMFVIPHEHHTVDSDGYWMTRIFFFSVDFLPVRIGFDKSPEALLFSPKLSQFLVGCFCAERPPLCLIFLSSLWDGRARLPLWLQNRRLPLDAKPLLHTRCSLLRGWLFRVCQSLLAPEYVKKPELGETVICEIHFYGLFHSS